MLPFSNRILNRSLFSLQNNLRAVLIHPTRCYKEIKVEEAESQITIEGVPIESDRKDYLINLPKGAQSDHACNSCPLCRLNLKNLAYSDVLILSQFINKDGSLMFHNDTGLCFKSYMKVKKLVKLAQTAKLLPRPPDFVVNGRWDNLNTYYEFPKRIRDQPISIIKKEYWR